jgi:hypothetical protein
MRLHTGALLALARRTSLKRALARYRKRWKIKSLFGALKTRGFNLEATHMADPARLSTLIALLTLAAALACKAGLAFASITPIRRKTYGVPAGSLFACGLDAIRKIFAPNGFSEALQIVLVGLTAGTRQLRRLCAA